MNKITARDTLEFIRHLQKEGKAPLTVEKYRRDLKAFSAYLRGREVTEERVTAYRDRLMKGYAPGSVNSILSALNRFFVYKGWCIRLRFLRIQKSPYMGKEKCLTKAEYERLLSAAKENERMYYLLQTICGSGIRVSELPFITAEAVAEGKAVISLKGKTRVVLLSRSLCRALERYAAKHHIHIGSLFVTRSGKPLDRSNIHHAMKKLCEKAGVDPRKVFPHNLRHLFARTFYRVQKDIVRLADILGHSSINTTRIYTMETGEEHRRMIESLGLVFV